MILILNDIATSEILLILVFVLIFFGSKSIPGLARTLGRTIRQVKDASNEIQNEIKKSGGDIKKDLDLKGILKETEEAVRRPLDQHVSDIDEAIKYVPPNKNSHIKPPVKKEAEPKQSESEGSEEKSADYASENKNNTSNESKA